MKPTLVIMAAGMGSRYGGLKQLDGVGPAGETLLDYSLYDAIQAGFGKVVFVVRRHFQQQFQERIVSRVPSEVETGLAIQELELLPEGFTVPEGREKPWGTGHAMLCAAEQVQGPFCVINADDFYGREAFEVMSRFLQRETDPRTQGMAGYRLEKTLSDHGTVSRGVCQVDIDGWLQGITERTALSRSGEGVEDHSDPEGTVRRFDPATLVSMNFWGFQPSVFDCLRLAFEEFLQAHGTEPKAEFYIPHAVDQALTEGRIRVKVLPVETSWYGVTYREDREGVVSVLQQMTSQQIYPSPLWPS